MVSTQWFRRSGAIWIVLGIVLCVVAVQIDIWEEHDVYTITQTITLPAFALLILGCWLGIAGYRRILRGSTGWAHAVALGVGFATSPALWLLAYDWQLAHGVYPYLLAYDAGILLFAGVALAIVSVFEEPRMDSNAAGTVLETAGRRRSFIRISEAGGTGMVVAAVCLYAGFGYSLSWLNTRIISVDPSYDLLALEVLGSAAILLGLGYRSVIRTWTRERKAIGQFAGVVAGGTLFASTFESLYPVGLYFELEFLMLNLLRVAGLLLVAAAVIPYSTRSKPSKVEAVGSPPDPATPMRFGNVGK